MTLTSLHTRFSLAIVCGILAGQAFAAAQVDVPLVPESWTTKGDFKFQTLEGFPHGLMESKGSAVLKGVVFGSGTIDLDFMSEAGISTIVFRRDDNTGEALVLRSQPDCPASNDCIQYTPVMHGAFLWDLYPQYQTKAPLSNKSWNHLHIVASGKRMRVFMNGLSQPVLSIDRMAGTLTEGSLRLSGTARWANLRIAAEEREGLPGNPVQGPTASDANLIRGWNVSQPVHVETIVDKKLDGTLGTLPSTDQSDANARKWRHLLSEDDGLVNLSREVGSAKGEEVTGVWLGTTVQSSRDQVKHVRLGWVREIAVFVNGKPVFQDRNLYGVPAMKKDPGGRLSLENGGFDLPLKKGANSVHVFLDDNFGGPQHFGWGMKMRLDDVSGVQLEK